MANSLLMASTRQIKVMVMIMKSSMLILNMSSRDLEHLQTYAPDQIESASKKSFQHPTIDISMSSI